MIRKVYIKKTIPTVTTLPLTSLSHCVVQIRWELHGLDEMLKPSQFSLSVKGALYPDRGGARSRLKGQLQMSISFVLPPMLALIPEDIRRDVAESVRHLSALFFSFSFLWFSCIFRVFEAIFLLCILYM